MLSPSRTARWVVFRGLALTLGGLGAVVACEIVLRVMDVAPSKNMFPDLYRRVDNPRLLYAMQPGFRGYAHGAWVRTNGNGFRGPSPSGAKDHGTIRIGLIGDSVVFGFGLEESETLSSQLEEATGPLTGPGGRIEVINLGVCGYNLEQELEVLRTQGLRLDLDLLVLVLMSNDADDAEPAARRRPPWRRMALAYSRAWALLEYQRWLGRFPDPRRYAPEGEPLARPLGSELEVWDEVGWNRFLETLDRFRNELGRAGIPWVLAYSGAPGAFESKLSEAVARRGVPYVPLQMAYGGLIGDPSFTLGWDGHPSARATAVMARTLAAAVAECAPRWVRTTSQRHGALRDQLASERATWAAIRRSTDEARISAIRSLPRRLDFPGGSGVVPYGVFWGLSRDGRMIPGGLARVALRGHGDALEVSGHARPGSRLGIAVAPEWRRMWFDPATSFALRLPLSRAAQAAPYIKVALCDAGEVRVRQISLTGAREATAAECTGTDEIVRVKDGTP
jgi:hypothetical protein